MLTILLCRRYSIRFIVAISTSVKIQQTIIHNINIAKAGATCVLEKHNLLALQVAFVLVILFLNLNNLNQDFRKKKK